MPTVLDQIPVISAGDVDTLSVDGTKYLDDGETFTGTPTIVEAGRFTGYNATTGVAEYTASSDLTIGSKTYNSGSTIVVNNRTVAISKGIQCSVQGQLAGYTYGVRITATTTAGRTRVMDALFTTV